MTDTCHDEFQMWQGLVGPYYIPSIDAAGNLSWSNTGGLTNPATINVIGPQGNGLYIGGIAETSGALPGTATEGSTWLVGNSEPYEGYVFLNGEWVDIGEVTPGPTGPQGQPGIGVPSGGTTGQVLQKSSGTDYATEWADPASGGDPPGTSTPLMDGTAAVGTAHSYAREDHRHPVDTSRAAAADALNKVLYLTDVAVSATTGDVVSVSNAAIDADHVLAECVFANPAAITTNLTWTTGSGTLKLNGTCASATTANIVLIRKDN